MIQISKNEANIIRKQFPGVSIKKTVHKYYVEENPLVISAIRRLSGSKGVCVNC